MVTASGSVSFHRLGDDIVARDWDELADELKAPPFARHEWFRAWGRSYEIPVEVATWGSGSLEAVVPVVRRGGSLIAPVNEETPGYEVVASSARSREGLLRGLIGGGSALLRKLGADDAAAVGAAVGERRIETEIMQRSPFIEIDGNWDRYEASLRPKFRKELRRQARRLGEIGDVASVRHEGVSSIATLLDEAFRIESLQWKGREGTAVASRPATRSFYEAIARWAGENGWLRLWFMHIDGAPAAFALDVVTAKIYYGLKVGYDPAYARFSPGMLLQDDTVRYAFDHGLRRFEFLGADEPYKLNWTSARHDRFAVRVFPGGVRGAVTRIASRSARTVLKRVRERRPRRGSASS